MANHTSMAKVNSIHTLHQSGHSKRQIAELLGIDRGTVGKFVQQLENQPNAPTGNPAKSTPHKPGPKSDCEPFRQTVLEKLQAGLSAKRIHQDLAAEHGFTGSYYSVKRFAARLRTSTPLPFGRMEVLPGEEAQVDFGMAAPVIDRDGKTRRPWMFRIVLSHSRKGYSEAVCRQSTDNFIAALENAFEHFGGVPKRRVIDNLKAAVKNADWYDPEIHPKLQSFAMHYGTVFVPTKSIEEACRVALAHRAHRLRSIRELLKRSADRVQKSHRTVELLLGLDPSVIQPPVATLFALAIRWLGTP